MGISRVQKYKEYRDSMIKDDCPDLETPEKEEQKVVNSNRNTTSTLPMDQVMESLNNEESEEEFFKKEKRKRTLTITFIVVGLTLLTIAIVIFGIIVWSK